MKIHLLIRYSIVLHASYILTTAERTPSVMPFLNRLSELHNISKIVQVVSGGVPFSVTLTSLCRMWHSHARSAMPPLQGRLLAVCLHHAACMLVLHPRPQVGSAHRRLPPHGSPCPPMCMLTLHPQTRSLPDPVCPSQSLGLHPSLCHLFQPPKRRALCAPSSRDRPHPQRHAPG